MLALMRVLGIVCVAAGAWLLAGCSSAGTDQQELSIAPGDDAAGVESGADGSMQLPPPDGGVPLADAHDATMPPPSDAGLSPDALPDGACFTSYGTFGECITTKACNAMADHTPEPGYCAGSSSIECCIDTPDTSDNPPIPAGWGPMQQSQVTPAMTTWAVNILHDPVAYPMYSTTMQLFGSLLVLARVEWHPPDFQNSAVHRGVTLYEQTD
jgi:hypothetical protein